MNQKVCTKCQTLKDLTHYNMDRGRRQSRCRDCRSLEYYNNRKRDLELNKRFYTKRKKEDNNFKLRCNLRSQVSKIIRRGKKSKNSYVESLQCYRHEFIDYIESLFVEGMSWKNYGYTTKEKGWEIDHIIPLKHFNLTIEEEFKKAANYKNCRPM